jgi:hypothetical protein
MKDIYNQLNDDIKTIINGFAKIESRFLLSGSIALKIYDLITRDCNDVDFIISKNDALFIYKKIRTAYNQYDQNVKFNILKINDFIHNRVDKCYFKVYINNKICDIIVVNEDKFVSGGTSRFGQIDINILQRDDVIKAKINASLDPNYKILPRSMNKHLQDLIEIQNKLGEAYIKELT